MRAGRESGTIRGMGKNVVDEILESQKRGCCVGRMDVCNCREHAVEAALLISWKILRILQTPDAIPALLAFVDELQGAS